MTQVIESASKTKPRFCFATMKNSMDGVFQSILSCGGNPPPCRSFYRARPATRQWPRAASCCHQPTVLPRVLLCSLAFLQIADNKRNNSHQAQPQDNHWLPSFKHTIGDSRGGEDNPNSAGILPRCLQVELRPCASIAPAVFIPIPRGSGRRGGGSSCRCRARTPPSASGR